MLRILRLLYFPSNATSQEDDDDLLVYDVYTPIPTLASTPVKPHITKNFLSSKTVQPQVQNWLLHH